MQEPASHQDAALIQRLRREAGTRLSEILQGRRDVALLDFPYHRNAGDAAIWLGELALLSDLGVRVRYVSDLSRYEPARLREALPEGPLLLHGGGSLGDLWRDPQMLRERVLRDFPDREVIQLPQSIFFRDRQRLDDFRRIADQHGRYVVMLRDRDSFDRAESLGVRPVLCPDMAFGLGPLSPCGGPSQLILCLARNDVEQSSQLQAFDGPDVLLADWALGSWGDRWWRAKKTVPRAGRMLKRNASMYRLVRPALHATWSSMARQSLRTALRLLSSANVVVTDRLHAHILCLLMGRDHVVLDNNYGKLSSFDATYLRDSVTTRWAQSTDDAIDIARSLVATRSSCSSE
jgi:exopolysaccharide biosynthesis predicted pyruvyltransferase EpsI